MLNLMQKGFALPLVLVGILLIGLIGAGGYYFYQTKSKDSQNIPTSRPSPQAQTIKKDETSDWKVYENQEIGYSIKYPTDANIKVYTTLSDISLNKTITIINFNKGNSYISILHEPNPNRLPVNQWLEERRKEEKMNCQLDCFGFSSDAKQMTIDGNEALGQSLGSVIGTENVYLSVDNYILWFRATTQSEIGPNETTKQLLLDMLQTFKFSDDETANWKIFDNSKFGYSFEYPTSWELESKESSEKHEVYVVSPLDDLKDDSYEFYFISQLDPIDDKSILDFSPDITDVNISFSKGKMYKIRKTGIAGTRYRVDIIFPFSPFYYHINFATAMENEERLDEFVKKFISRMRLSVH